MSIFSLWLTFRCFACNLKCIAKNELNLFCIFLCTRWRFILCFLTMQSGVPFVPGYQSVLILLSHGSWRKGNRQVQPCAGYLGYHTPHSLHMVTDASYMWWCQLVGVPFPFTSAVSLLFKSLWAMAHRSKLALMFEIKTMKANWCFKKTTPICI